MPSAAENVNKSTRSVFNGFKWRPIRSHESHEFNDCALVELGAMCLEDGKNIEFVKIRATEQVAINK